jgi:hypothetical protein
MYFVGGAGVSGYAPWATWLDILLVVGGVTAAAIITVWFSSHRKQKAARPQ